MKKTLVVIILCLFGFNLIGQIPKDTLLVGYSPSAPFIMEANGKLEGINVWLWDRVAKDLGFEYKLLDMEFSAVLDSLKTGGVDLCIDPLTITSERSKEMEFTHSFFASHSTIAVAQLSTLQKFKQFLGAFFNVNFLRGLLLLFVIVLSFGIAIWLFERSKNPTHFRRGYKGIWDGLWWTVVTMTTVGYGDKTPLSRLGKIAALALMFSGLLFISGLTASVASNLTVNRLSSNSDSFGQFKDRKVGTVKSSSSEDFLRGHFFKNIELYPSMVPGLEDLKKHKTDAFIYDEPILMYRIKKDSTLRDIHILPIKFDVQFYAFGLSKNRVELEPLISQRILEIMETQEWQVVLNEYGLNEL